MPDSLATSVPTTKEKNAVQRNVTALLDVLAPDRVLARGTRVALRVEPHRTVTGCILQGSDAAVSVSWFANASLATFGELHVVVWRGTLVRRGATPRGHAATIIKELLFRPIEPPSRQQLWRRSDGTERDTETLAADCIALLEAELKAG